MSCKDCAFAFKRYEHQSAYLECRKRAPIAGDKESGVRGRQAIWPDVSGNDYCGEFQRTLQDLAHPRHKDTP